MESQSSLERLGTRLYRVGWHLGRLLTAIYGSLVVGFIEGVQSRLGEGHHHAAE